MNLRKVGSQPFAALLSTLSSLRAQVKEINLTFHFIHWLREVDHDHLCNMWDWEALDQLIASLFVLTPHSPQANSLIPVHFSTSRTPSEATVPLLKAVRLNFDCDDSDSQGSVWIDAIEGRIKDLMNQCQIQGILAVQRMDVSE